MQTHCQRHISFLYSCLLCSVLTRYCLSLIFGLPIRDMFWPDLQLLIRTGLIRLHYWSNCKRYANESWSDMYFTHIWQTPAHSALPGWHLGNFHWVFLCFVIHILKLISAISTHYTTKIVIGDNQQEVKKVFDKKKFLDFFFGKCQKMDLKIRNFWRPISCKRRRTPHMSCTSNERSIQGH